MPDANVRLPQNAMAQPSQNPGLRPKREKTWLAITEAHITETIWIAIGSVFSADPDSL